MVILITVIIIDRNLSFSFIEIKYIMSPWQPFLMTGLIDITIPVTVTKL